MRNTPQSLRAKIRGGDPELYPRIVGPATPLVHRLPAPERASQLQVQVRHGDLERPSNRDQAVRRDVFEAALDLGQVGGRELGRSRKLAERLLRFLPMPTDQAAERVAHRARVFAVSVGHLLGAYGSTFVAPLRAHAWSCGLVLYACQAGLRRSESRAPARRSR